MKYTLYQHLRKCMMSLLLFVFIIDVDCAAVVWNLIPQEELDIGTQESAISTAYLSICHILST